MTTSMDTQQPDTEKRPGGDFESAAHEKKTGIITEFFDFLKHNKKWWLTPIVIVLLLVAAFVILGGTVAAPFIYTLF